MRDRLFGQLKMVYLYKLVISVLMTPHKAAQLRSQASAMLAHGVFDRFPRLRVAFLERGATWVPFMMDRLDRSYHDGHMQLDLNSELIGDRSRAKRPAITSRSICAKDAFSSVLTAMMTA